MRFALVACLCLVVAGPAFGQKQVNVYNWSDYIAEDQLKVFSKDTGIKVNYTTYDSNEILDAKLKTGRSGYDVVVPTASPFFVRQLAAKLYQPLDKAKLKNWGNLDPRIMAELAKYDPGNAHAIPWMWGTIGIGYNVHAIKKRMINAPVDSLSMIFDPAIVSRFVDCGVMVLDSPTDVFPAALKYLLLDPDSKKPEDLDKAAGGDQGDPALRPQVPLLRVHQRARGRRHLPRLRLLRRHLPGARPRRGSGREARHRLCHSQPGRDAVDRRRRDPQGRAQPRRPPTASSTSCSSPRSPPPRAMLTGYANANAAGDAAAGQVDHPEPADLSRRPTTAPSSTPSPPPPPSRCASAPGCGPRSRPADE